MVIFLVHFLSPDELISLIWILKREDFLLHRSSQLKHSHINTNEKFNSLNITKGKTEPVLKSQPNFNLNILTLEACLTQLNFKILK